MTLWGNNLAWILPLLSVYLSKNPARSPLRKLTLQLTEFTMSMQIVITLVYWLMIHHEVKPKLEAEGRELMLFINIYIHFLPLLSMIILVLLQNTGFSAKHFPFTFVVSCVFILVNFASCKIAGKQYYPFFPFNDVQSWITAAFLVVSATVCYVVTALVVGLLPKNVRKDTDHRKKK